LILNIDIAYENNTSWRFVPTSYDFPNNLNPWQEDFPEQVTINNLKSDNSVFDFIGIKIGDVSGDAPIENSRKLEGRSNKSWSLYYDDQNLEANKTYQIPIFGNPRQIDGLQFGLKVKPELASLIDVAPQLFQDFNYNTNKQEGNLLVSWLQSDTKNLMQEEEIFFILSIKPHRAVPLSSILSINGQLISSEAYINNFPVKLNLSPNSTSKPTTIQLKNYPNPFQHYTQIEFTLPKQEQIKLDILDAQGKKIKTIIQNYPAGNHRIQVNGADLAGPGLYFIHLKAGSFEQSNRMIYF